MKHDLGKKDSIHLQCPQCGAECTEKNRAKRFMKRHPAECQRRLAEDRKRTEIAKSLAQGTRCIDEEEGTISVFLGSQKGR